MSKTIEHKTNAMRLLDAASVSYNTYHFDASQVLSGVEVANLLDVEPERVFKTLVTQGKSGAHYVFMIPVAEELDLKKAALSVGEKAIAMIKSKELLGLTGYIHGGCSPLGMKKQFTTTIDETASICDEIIFSGGKRGFQIEMSLEALQKVLAIKEADLTLR